jgi:hypothetical protein
MFNQYYIIALEEEESLEASLHFFSGQLTPPKRSKIIVKSADK